MLKILYAGAGQNSRHALLERMGRSAAPRRVLLVPEQYSHESERNLCALLGNGASRHCEVLTFTRMARRVSDLWGGGAAPMLDGGGRMLLMYAALRQVADQLRFYKTPSRKPAFLSSLLATADECVSYRVSPATLMELGEARSGQQGDKWRDIGLICHAYAGLCAASAADPHGLLDRLADQLEESGWGEGMEFFIHGFTDFTPQQEQVILTLAGQGDVTLALLGGQEDEGDVFEASRRAAARLKRKLPGTAEERLRGYDGHTQPSLAFLERHLFGPLPDPWRGACAVRRVRCADVRREVEWTAAEVLRLVGEEGYRYRDIALCARKLGAYSEVVESTFARFGIPVFESVMTDVLQKPVLALVTSALAAAAEEYPYEELFRYLKTDLTGLSREERDLLENYVLTWNIRGGTWYRAKPWDMHPEGYGLEWKDHHRRKVARLDGLRRRVIEPLEKLRRGADKTGRGRALALYDLLCHIDLPRRLAQRANSMEERGDLNGAAQYRQLWDILVGALEQCAIHLEQTELELDEFSRLFSLVLSQYDVGTIPVSLDRVTVSEGHRMAHKEVKVLFFLGTDSGAIPACEPDAGLLSDQDRAALAALSVELAPGQEEKLRREMAVAYETCAIPSDKLYLSYAALTAAGEERAPCFLWERLAALFPGEAVETAGESRLAAPMPALELAGRDGALARALTAVPACAPGLERLERGRSWKRGRLSPGGVEALFGDTVPMSATRLDLFNSCHFGHFLRFGLGARPRQEAKFRPTEYGTFVHEVLEKVLSQAEANGGIAALAADEALRRSLALRAADEYVEASLSGLEEEPARFRWLFERMKGAALAVADSVVAELAVSDFVPSHFELGFSRSEDTLLPPIEVEQGVKLSLSGYVDRVDQWVHEGKRYLRVVDYKTGKKNFKFSDVQDGRGLQMLLYLFALTRFGGEVMGSEELVPAGVLYVPARNPVISGERSMTAEEVARAQSAQLRRQGLVLGEQDVMGAMEHGGDGYRFLPVTEGRGGKDYLVTREQMERLDRYVTDALKQAAGQMAAGNIDADPYWHDDNRNACLWCQYKAACHFEECCGDQRRRRRNITGPDFWRGLSEGEGGEQDGHEAD